MNAIRTTDTKQWVNVDPTTELYYVSSTPCLYGENWNKDSLNELLEQANVETQHPCEWVDVEVIEKDHSSEPIPAEMNDAEKEDDSQELYDTIKGRIKKFLIHKVNTMKWFNVEVMGTTTDAVIVDDLIKIIKSY